MHSLRPPGHQRRRHRAVVEVLRSDFLTQGPAVAALRGGVRARLRRRARGCGATARPRRCTWPAWRSGVGPGDGVDQRRSPSSPSANCARYCGADVDFVDIDPRTYNMSAEALGAKLAGARAAARCRRSWCRCTSLGSRATWRRSAPSAGDTAPRRRGRVARGRRLAIAASPSATAATATSRSSASTR